MGYAPYSSRQVQDSTWGRTTGKVSTGKVWLGKDSYIRTLITHHDGDCGLIIRSIDLVTSYLLLSPVRHHNHLRTGSCCGAVDSSNVTRPHPRSAYVDVSPHLHTTRVTWPHVSSTQTRRGDWFYCKLVLVCKMRITGGPGPGFAQQQSDHILHPDT